MNLPCSSITSHEKDPVGCVSYVHTDRHTHTNAHTNALMHAFPCVNIHECKTHLTPPVSVCKQNDADMTDESRANYRPLWPNTLHVFRFRAE